ncbi:hypothetical protein BO82DRAFT_364874 [Aspergillus uvarum CBS 121591]|uniref:Uncharacterized protein n=1 Tax=Aspergillus uvarum CBS 121591 TaxID=1448315 RepID=A0A319CC05_9EURO|nr:hypothetical protein BO82DRAFT_364874 [Aspergillus uvarum CBS 121591]PYH81699.1 hypothetical protein BO82DRAFT_364874 [Aspergillus uvarum CBS 121591]
MTPVNGQVRSGQESSRHQARTMMVVYLPLKRCQQTETGNSPSFFHPFTVGIHSMGDASELDPFRYEVIEKATQVETYWTVVTEFFKEAQGNRGVVRRRDIRLPVAATCCWIHGKEKPADVVIPAAASQSRTLWTWSVYFCHVPVCLPPPPPLSFENILPTGQGYSILTSYISPTVSVCRATADGRPLTIFVQSADVSEEMGKSAVVEGKEGRKNEQEGRESGIKQFKTTNNDSHAPLHPAEADEIIRELEQTSERSARHVGGSDRSRKWDFCQAHGGPPTKAQTNKCVGIPSPENNDSPSPLLTHSARTLTSSTGSGRIVNGYLAITLPIPHC